MEKKISAFLPAEVIHLSGASVRKQVLAVLLLCEEENARLESAKNAARVSFSALNPHFSPQSLPCCGVR